MGTGAEGIFALHPGLTVLMELVLVMAVSVVAAVADAASTRKVVETPRSLNSSTQIIAHTRSLREMEPLAALGADQVIPEEFETSLGLSGSVFGLYGASPSVVGATAIVVRRTSPVAETSGVILVG